MTDKERLAALRKTMRGPLRWYAEMVEDPDIDDSYLYDLAVDQIADLSRGDALGLLSLLHEGAGQ